MNKRKIGTLDVSSVGLGCNNFGGRIDGAATRAVVDAALEAGITLLDTADIYGGTRSEEFLGRILNGRREGVVLASNRPISRVTSACSRAISLAALRSHSVNSRVRIPSADHECAGGLLTKRLWVSEGPIRSLTNCYLSANFFLLEVFRCVC